MAKVSFTKLNLKTNITTVLLKWGEQEIEVKQYLPIEEKIDLITNVLQSSHDPQNNFANPMKLDVYTVIECIERYTNLNITDKQKENPQKLYDVLVSSGFWTEVKRHIKDFESVDYYLKTTIEAFYKYRTSILGILDTVSNDYSNLDLNATEIQKKLGDPTNLDFLKSVLSKLG